jgi:hypothetical protein
MRVSLWLLLAGAVVCSGVLENRAQLERRAQERPLEDAERSLLAGGERSTAERTRQRTAAAPARARPQTGCAGASRAASPARLGGAGAALAS